MDKHYEQYMEMQRKYYDNTSIPSKEIVGNYEVNEAFPYETFLLFINGDLRFPIFEDFSDKVALDFACGPGRMVKRMSRLFKRVDGVDIAPRLIEEAKTNCPGSNFYVSSGDDLGDAPENTYDFVYSTIAMQHIAVYSVRMNILKHINNVLKEDGCFTIQMAFNKHSPFSYTLADGILNDDIRVIVKLKEKRHAYWLEDRIDANCTNGACDVAIGPADVPLVVADFSRYFRDIRVWFCEDSLFNIDIYDLESVVKNEGNFYWATHKIFIHGRK